MSAKRQRSCGSNGSLNSLSYATEGVPVVPLDKVVQVFDNETTELTQDEKHETYLACPFWKHNPNRYLHVRNSCTEGFGFKDIGKLTEHIRRVHCLWNGCEKCRKRFNQCRHEKVEQEKREHMANCTKSVKLKDTEAEWMNEDQDVKYRLLNFQKDKGDPGHCYKKICDALWGTDKNAIQGPYHLPGFQVSVLRWRFLRALELLRVPQNVEPSHHGVATTVPPLIVDPMLLSQALHDLPSGPEPFYRGQHRKDSGVWSWEHSSENQPSFAKPLLPDFHCDDDGSEEDISTLAEKNSNMDKAGTWTNSTGHEGMSYELEMDADDEDPFGL